MYFSFLINKYSFILKKLQRWKNVEKPYKMCFLKTQAQPEVMILEKRPTSITLCTLFTPR